MEDIHGVDVSWLHHTSRGEQHRAETQIRLYKEIVEKICGTNTYLQTIISDNMRQHPLITHLKMFPSLPQATVRPLSRPMTSQVPIPNQRHPYPVLQLRHRPLLPRLT